MGEGGIATLPTFDSEGRLLAVIEAPRGSANKLKFEPQMGAFKLHKVLPPGSVFPLDFGFVPGTLGADGDPLDVLLLMDEPGTPSVVVPCRLLGVIEAVQRATRDTRGARSVRNDRLVAVADATHRYAGYRSLRDVGAALLDEVEAFFVSYNERMGKTFTPTRRAGVDVARRLVKAGMAAARGGRD
jgi:inorganic pyrophosphatase